MKNVNGFVLDSEDTHIDLHNLDLSLTTWLNVEIHRQIHIIQIYHRLHDRMLEHIQDLQNENL